MLSEILSESWKISRASTMVDAERMLFEDDLYLYLLDVSLDVVAGTAAFGALPQATLGGLKLANTMVIEDLEKPTIIITGFDAFSDSPVGRNLTTVIDLHHVRQNMKEILGDSYLGCVRYGTESWKEEIKCIFKEIS